MTATTELVVPRSIPIIRPMMLVVSSNCMISACHSCFIGNANQRRAQHAVATYITFLQRHRDVTTFHRCRCPDRCFVQVRIENFAHRINGLECPGHLQRFLQFALDGDLMPSSQGCSSRSSGTIGRRPFEVVEDRQQQVFSVSAAVCCRIAQVTLRPFFIVAEVGTLTLPAFEVRLACCLPGRCFQFQLPASALLPGLLTSSVAAASSGGSTFSGRQSALCLVRSRTHVLPVDRLHERSNRSVSASVTGCIIE
jgi:hypothetical protein